MEALDGDGDAVKAPRQVDPCRKIHCGAGRVCQAEGNTASCVCIPSCPVEDDSRRRVCTNFNQTWASDCEVYRQRCLCDKKDPLCKDKQIKHIHIDYYGECRQVEQCSSEEKEDFPRRMRDWLFNVMKDLADRRELSAHYIEMTHEAETNMTRRWSNAAIWKWCDLDGHPHDRSVSRHELFPIRAPLLSLEHCIAPVSFAGISLKGTTG
jgi:secreted protein acidic and rich in cysteine